MVGVKWRTRRDSLIVKAERLGLLLEIAPADTNKSCYKFEWLPGIYTSVYGAREAEIFLIGFERGKQQVAAVIKPKVVRKPGFSFGRSINGWDRNHE